MTRTCTTFKSERNFKIFYTCYVTCWALTTVHKHSHLWLLWQQPQAQPASHNHTYTLQVIQSLHLPHIAITCLYPADFQHLIWAFIHQWRKQKQKGGKKWNCLHANTITANYTSCHLKVMSGGHVCENRYLTLLPPRFLVQSDFWRELEK